MSFCLTRITFESPSGGKSTMNSIRSNFETHLRTRMETKRSFVNLIAASSKLNLSCRTRVVGLRIFIGLWEI